MKLYTERLELVPLTSEQLSLWVADVAALEQTLGCLYKVEPLDSDFGEIVRGQVSKTAAAGEAYFYHTFWFLIRGEDRAVVGSACFKGLPNPQGEVEIGYGLGERFKHCGYMAEAVAALCAWAIQQDHVTAVIAETDPANIPSQNVLRRCGFSVYRRDSALWWRLAK